MFAPRQLAKILISHDRDPLSLKSDDRDEFEGMFNKFEYEDENLEEAKGYFTKEVSSNELYNILGETIFHLAFTLPISKNF
ncbi:12394_t:CDS:2 [Cetraspora pellucida]|uniref:12394_t:CDS:1 n=1 Tax=Cetraspora pellucida TaxID=1433469 RepID=A0A9N9E099_9GLOM|nr:12394_t:CDS:2 [Cetraspora pellucida]